MTLDITDDAQVAALARELPQRLDAVVNNAGVVVAGPVEAIPLAELRRQLEINVVGQAAVTQAVLPRLRSAAKGRIVFVSSVSGRIATPMFGPYSASKFALEAMADALRMELAPWGIRVALVEPAQTDTDLWRHAEDELDSTSAQLSKEHRRLYARHIEGFRRTIPRSMKAAAPADGVAATIERALYRPPAQGPLRGRPARPRSRPCSGGSCRRRCWIGCWRSAPASRGAPVSGGRRRGGGRRGYEAAGVTGATARGAVRGPRSPTRHHGGRIADSTQASWTIRSACTSVKPASATIRSQTVTGRVFSWMRRAKRNTFLRIRHQPAGPAHHHRAQLGGDDRPVVRVGAAAEHHVPDHELAAGLEPDDRVGEQRALVGVTEVVQRVVGDDQVDARRDRARGPGSAS